MLGNWSLGDYGKRESLAWTLELLVDVLGLDFERLTFTIYPGDDEALRPLGLARRAAGADQRS